jgi:hypothetical protein
MQLEAVSWCHPLGGSGQEEAGPMQDRPTPRRIRRWGSPAATADGVGADGALSRRVWLGGGARTVETADSEDGTGAVESADAVS